MIFNLGDIVKKKGRGGQTYRVTRLDDFVDFLWMTIQTENRKLETRNGITSLVPTSGPKLVRQLDYEVVTDIDLL